MTDDDRNAVIELCAHMAEKTGDEIIRKWGQNNVTDPYTAAIKQVCENIRSLKSTPSK